MATRNLGLLPAFLRFGLVGSVGLASDTMIFTFVSGLGINPFSSRIVSLVFATLMTWTLNRHLTFQKQQRALRNEASLYALVTVVAQGVSYLIFASLVLLFPHLLHQLSLIIGAAVGAVFSFKGHKAVSFAPITKQVS